MVCSVRKDTTDSSDWVIFPCDHFQRELFTVSNLSRKLLSSSLRNSSIISIPSDLKSIRSMIKRVAAEKFKLDPFHIGLLVHCSSPLRILEFIDSFRQDLHNT